MARDAAMSLSLYTSGLVRHHTLLRHCVIAHTCIASGRETACPTQAAWTVPILPSRPPPSWPGCTAWPEVGTCQGSPKPLRTARDGLLCCWRASGKCRMQRCTQANGPTGISVHFFHFDPIFARNAWAQTLHLPVELPSKGVPPTLA